MKILFANPAYRVDLGNSYERYFFCVGSRCPWSLIKRKNELPRYAAVPFFIAYAAALLEQYEYAVEIIDAVPLNMLEEDVCKQIESEKPDVILFESVTVNFKWIAKLSHDIKNRTGAKIIFTGTHVSVYPTQTLRDYSHIDFILAGEYEFSCLYLIQSLEGKRKYEDVPGLTYKDSFGCIVTNKMEIELELDKLPYPARHLLPIRNRNNLGCYHDGFCQNRPAVEIQSSRGCPFKCSFCVWPQVMYPHSPYRMFSPGRVVAEVKEVIQKYDAREIYFDDDTFTADQKHVIDICDEFQKNRLNIPWSAMCDAIITNDKMLHAMKKAGCIGVKFGVESADPEILKRMNKPLQLERLEHLLKTCRSLKIKTHLMVSFGHMGETKETIEKTISYMDYLDMDSVQFHVTTPYPGTIFYNEMHQKSAKEIEAWEYLDPTNNVIIDVPGLPRKQFQQIFASCHRRWLRKKLAKPRWVIRQMFLIAYLIKGQGIKGLMKRIRRGFFILFQKKFR
jgi:radical SAM superfamily enzyme YgiQ (UPF0313 family)